MQRRKEQRQGPLCPLPLKNLISEATGIAAQMSGPRFCEIKSIGLADKVDPPSLPAHTIRRAKMNRQVKNLDYCGVITILRQLVKAGACTETEAQKVAARVAVKFGIDIINANRGSSKRPCGVVQKRSRVWYNSRKRLLYQLQIRQHLPQSHGRVCDEGHGGQGRTVRAILHCYKCRISQCGKRAWRCACQQYTVKTS